MLGAMQLLHTHDGEQIAGNATDLGTHRIEQMTELLDVWFTCSIVDGGGTFCQHRCHDDIGSTRNRSLIEEHIRALQMLCLDGEHLALVVADELRPKILESEEVGVQSAATNLVATRL